MNEISAAAQMQAFLKETSSGQAVRRDGSDFQTTLNRQRGSTASSLDDIFEAAGARYGISPALLKSVAKAESNFNPRAKSHAGAMGVMQLMPATARSLGVSDPYDPWQNIMGGAKYLKQNLDQFGDVSLALAAYNAGPGSVRKYGGIPPYRETQNYVKKIMADYNGPGVIQATYSHTGKQMGNHTEISSEYRYRGSDWMSAASLLGSASGGPYNLAALYSQAQNREGGLKGEDWANLVQIVRMQMMMDSDSDMGLLI